MSYYRNRPQEYPTPSDPELAGERVYLLTHNPAEYYQSEEHRQAIAALYGTGALAVLDSVLKLPEHIEAQFVSGPSIYGGPVVIVPPTVDIKPGIGPGDQAILDAIAKLEKRIFGE